MDLLKRGVPARGAVVSVVVACALAFPTAAFATVEDNQIAATEEEIASALADGTIKREGQETSGIGNPDDAASAFSGKRAASPVAVKEFSGATMFETAVSEAKAAFPSAATAIIAGPGDAWVDALASTGLAGALDCPILFTDRDSLHPATKQALADLGVQNAVVVGGAAAVGDGVVNELASLGISLKTRLAGENCYGTQMAIYRYGKDNNLWNNEMVILATGTHYGDALSVSPLAFAKRAPIFLIDSSKDLSSEQRESLFAGARAGYGKTVAVAGGPAVVSDAALGSADFVSAAAGGSGDCVALWGATQYETSIEIARWAVGSQGFSWNNAAFTTGDAPYDALAGSVLQGKNKSVLLLAADYNTSTVNAAAAEKAAIANISFFGGVSAVSPYIRMSVADKLGFPYTALPGYKVYVDAGHGYNDLGSGGYISGAVGSGYVEADLNRELANRVGDILRNDYGVDVYVNDDGGPYKYRHAEAQALGCYSVVSIHFNASGGTGSESLIHSYNASPLSAGWQSQIHPYLIEGVGLYDRGKKTQEVAILGGSLPAVLLEVCFIDNPRDMERYQTRKGEIARKIAEGIVS